MKTIFLLLLAAVPAFADGSDWIVVKVQPVKAPHIESDWTLDTDGSYVRKIPGWTAPATATSTTPQTRTQSSVPAVTLAYPTIPVTTVPVVAASNTPSPVFYPVASTYTFVPTRRAVRSGGIVNFGASVGGCVGGG